MCLFLMKLMEEGKKKSAVNRCVISPLIYWRIHLSFMEVADMQIYSEWSRYSPLRDQFLQHAEEKGTWLSMWPCKAVPKASPKFGVQDGLKGQYIYFFSESMFFSPNFVSVLGQERFPLSFVVCVSHVLCMRWPGLTFGLLPAPLCWGGQCKMSSPPPCFARAHPATDSWICIIGILRWLLQETLLPSVRWVLATQSPSSSLEPQCQSQVPLTGDLNLASRHI